MADVMRLLDAIGQGDPCASAELLPLVYDELRVLARTQMAHERPEHTLQATALVHEAYLRLVDGAARVRWDSRGHFFAAAAEAMRRILIDSARKRSTLKRGGECHRVDLLDEPATLAPSQLDVLALDEALKKLEIEHPEKAQLVKLRFFAGCGLEESAKMLGISRATAQRDWAFARAWLFGQLNPS
jgi:RNA polymerase sigma factor (TIGR02999 family)